MSKSNRRYRPYVRQRRPRGAASTGGAGALASRAGRGLGQAGPRTEIDVLEPRKLLFSLTVTADDINPATGLGTVTTQFGYVIPYLFKEIPDPVAGDVVGEEFEDEDAPWTLLIPPTPPSGTFFAESEIRITYSTISASPVVLTPPDAADDRDLSITLSTTDQMSFEFFDGVDEGNPVRRVANAAVFTIAGLNTSATEGTRIELLRGGVVVRTLIGAQITAVGQAVADGVAYTLTAPTGFDTVRFSSAAVAPDNATYFDAFLLDDINVTFPGGRFTEFNTSRVFGVQATLTGPIGASARFLDLYGREMIETIVLGAPNGVTVPVVDQNDDGVPDFNDGFGRVILTGVNEQSVLTLWGGTINIDDDDPFEIADVDGLYDAFESAGFGYALTTADPPAVIGLPPAPGSIALGSPVVRNNATPATYLSQNIPGWGFVGAGFSIPPGDWFVRPDQGVFAPNNETVGSVMVHGILHGSSNFTGALARLNVGLMVGSAAVNGDLGNLTVGTDAGLWVRDDLAPGENIPTPVNETNSEIAVGRTVGSIDVAGRCAADINVTGDINNTARQALNFLNYTEREVVYGINPAAGEEAAVNATIFSDSRAEQAIVFGNGFLRNDSITSAEFIGYNAAAVRIAGQLGLQDPVNTNEDAADIYAFAADGTTDIVIEGAFGTILGGFGGFIGFRGLGLYARIVDHNGRAVAGTSAPDISGRNAGAGTIRFRPDHPDIYYLVIGDVTDGGFASGTPYQLTLTGMAATTFGSYRSAAATGNGGGGLEPNVFTLGAGSMGTMRVGTGYFASGGQENGSAEILNNNLNVDDLLNFFASSISIPGNLYNITAGSDVAGPSIFVGGNLGGIVTGIAPAAGIGVTEGDLTVLDLTVGGSIGLMDIKGGIGINQDPDPDARGSIVTIRTGRGGGPGNIGEILVGAYMSAAAFVLDTSPGSVIDAFIVGNTNGGAGTDFPAQIRDGTPFIRMGPGSDLRFADFALVQRPGDADAFTRLNAGQTIQLTDDAGATIRIRIVGGAATSFADIRVLPIDGSQGVAISRLDVTLNGGSVLEIDGLTAGIVSIGRINVTTNAAGSAIRIGGNLTQIDVWRIDHTAGPALAEIRNLSPNGDIVAIDALGLTQLRIGTGDLGRTQTHGIGPTLLGPFMGLQAGLNGTVRGALGISANTINIPGGAPDWDSSIFTAVATTDYVAPSPLEDLGSPLDPYLNGLVVRTGDVTLVSVGGAIGDVILQGGHLITVIANADNISALTDFDGIVGNIYAPVIGTVDVGDGLLGEGPGPFATAGIFAEDDIVRVVGARRPGLEIRGLILAANNVSATPRVTIGTALPQPTPFAVNGMGQVDVRNGRYNNAFINVGALDDFWQSIRVSDVNFSLGDINLVNGVLTDMFRTVVMGDSITAITLQGGAFDASFVNATNNIGNVFAGEFRNTTRDGEPLEFRENTIIATGNVANVRVYNAAADMADLTIDIGGSITGGVSARNLVRVNFEVDNTIQDVFAANDVRAVNVNAGRIIRLAANADIRSTSFNVAGPIIQVIAGNDITSTHISSTGPDGQILLVQSRFFLTGEISSSGPIGTITSIEGDVIASIVTTDGDGSLQLLHAGRDLLVSTDIAGDVVQITAGRNIGQQGEPRGSRVINVQQNLTNIFTTSGQIYTDVRVGQSIVGVIRNARVAALPTSDLTSTATFVAFGRINAFEINGDFNGSIISESGGIGSVQVFNGSTRPGTRIEARDGSIDSVIITGGHLMGDIISEESIGQVLVLAGADGFWGSIGVAPYLSQFNGFDALRNQLPPGVAADNSFSGPTIRAGTNIGIVRTEKASMWETTIIAGHSVGQVHVAEVVMDNNPGGPGLGGFAVGGDSVMLFEVGGFVRNFIILAGVTDLGADNMPGGVGANTDTVQFGRIGDLRFHNGSEVLIVAAGINAGPNGLYNDADDEVANGISFINSVIVDGSVVNTFVFADNGIFGSSPGMVLGGHGLNQAEPNKVIEFVPDPSELVPGSLAFTTAAGEHGTITLTGPGQAYWNPSLGRLALINTTPESRLTVDTAENKLTNFTIISNDGSSIGFASIRANLVGNSNFYFDGYVDFVEFGALDMTGSIGAGNDIQMLIVGPVTRGTIDANHIQNLIVGGDFGLRNQTGEATVRVLSAGNISTFGALQGLITSKRDIASVNIGGAIDRASIRSGRSIGSLTAASISESRVSARNDVAVVNITGNVFDSLIYAGADLGADGAFGGTGANADVVTNGNINSVFIGGDFLESDIAAGIARGDDGFLGTPDDQVDEGRSNIGPVVIVGNQVGSTFQSESYRVTSNGTIGTVTVGNENVTERGNFAVAKVAARPNALRVMQINVFENSRVYTAHITFNQPVDQSTISPALNIFEVRSGGVVTIRLSENVDYTVTYEPGTNTALVTFSRTVTDRSLPQTNGIPGPGIYRFTLDAAILRGQTQNALLDGNGDGVPTAGDNFSGDNIVGDAGDKLVNNTVVVSGRTIDFYAATDLNVVMDNNFTSDGQPDINTTFLLRGTIGDHPDHDINVFRAAGDVDLYRITLQAGQILRLGAMQGVAQLADRQLLDAGGNILAGTNALAQELPGPLGDVTDLTFERQFLIKQTGTYFIGVASSFDLVNVTDPGNVANISTLPGATGAYSFSVLVFDDGDTGFAGDSPSGNGVPVAAAPVPSAFAGPDTQLNTPDDLVSIPSGLFNFFLNAGPDGVKGTGDDVVSGTNTFGITSSRTSGSDGVFGTSDDRQVSFITASIGESNFAGVPNVVTPDVDVFHLNNGDPILPNTRIRATLQLTEIGANIGLSPNPLISDLRGSVQFALFETSTSVGVSDALLVAAPTDVLPVGGVPNQTVSDGTTTYGYDANGDFFIDFVIPGRQGVPGAAPARYALYIQGAMRSDYALEIVTQGTATSPRSIQNVLIETHGGTIDWLEAGRGVTTSLDAFKTSVVGFSGLIGVQTVDNYVISTLLTSLNAIFAAANVDIRLATSAAAFEGEDFSTVFLTGSNEPTAFFDNGTFGAAEHSDAFNADRNDEAVVFMPQLAVLGNPPTRAGVDSLTQSLTASVARRIGELVGLRTLDPGSAPITDPMNANSVAAGSPAPYRFSNVNANLSANFDALTDTDFFLGQQNSINLLDRILADRF